MARKVGSVEIDIKGDSSHFNREMRGTEGAAKRSNNVIRGEFAKTEAAAAKVNGSIKAIGTSMIALAAGAALGVGASIGVLKDFGAAMSTVKAVTGASETQMAALTAEARRLGATTKFSATQAAEGMIYLARAGFTANEAMMSIEGTLKLAQSGNLELGRAADIASNVLGGFNLTAAETPRVVDVLAKAANSANVTVESLGEALKFAAPTANALGVELEETVAIIGKLGDSGLQGGLGGRGFQSFATAFVGKKDEIKAIIGDFNVADEGIIKLVQRLVKAGIATEDVIKIFRAENLDVFTILANASQDAAKGLEPLLKKLVEAKGTADEVARIMGENLNGAILTAQSALQELILVLGEAGATDALIAAFSGLTSLFRLAAENADILGVTIAALAARVLIPLAIQTVPAAIGALGALGASLLGVGTAATKATGAAALLGGPLTLIIAAGAAAYVALGRSIITLDEAVKSFDKNLTKLKSTQKDIKSDTDKLKTANEKLAEAILAGGDAAVAAANLEVDAISKRIIANKQLEEVYKTRLQADLENAKAAEKGLGNDARQSLGLERRFDLTGNGEVARQTEAATKAFLEYVTAQQEAGRALTDNERKTLDAIVAYDEARQSVKALAEQLENLGKPVELPDPVEVTEQPKQKQSQTTEEDAQKILDKQKQIREEAEKAYELTLARAQGNAELVASLEEQAEIEKLAATYVAGGLVAAEARLQAEREIEAIKAAQLLTTEQLAAAEARRDNFRLNKEERDSKQKEIEDAIEESRDKFRETFSGAVEEALKSGNVGDAIKTVFADRVTEGMKEALNDLADTIYDLFSDLFKSTNAGSSGGGGLGGFLGSLGSSLISGGIGALFGGGPGPASGTSSVGKHVGGNNRIGDTIINIAGDASEKTIAIMDEKLAQHRAALPSAIDSRVSEGLKRGRY